MSHSPGGRSSGWRRVAPLRRPRTWAAWALAAGSDSPTDHPPAPSGTATSASDGARSSAKPPSPSATSGPTCCGVPPSSAERRAAATRSRPGSATGRAVAAATMDRHPVHRHRWASNACSTAAGGAGPPAVSSAASRTMIPGVQNPHWLAPAWQKASAQRRRTGSARPSSVVTVRPATRRAGVTHATRGMPSTRTVQQPHWPWGLHPSLTLRCPSRSRSTSSRVAPSSGRSTWRPSTRMPYSTGPD